MSELNYQNIGRCEIPGNLRNVAKAAQLLKVYCEQRLIEPTLWAELEVAFCEGLNNAIEHGCQEDESKTVHVLWNWEGDWLTIEIEDPGPYSDEEIDPDLPEDPLQESGRGYFIINTIFDQVTRQPTDKGQMLVLKKQLHPQHDSVDKMQEMYEALQAVTGKLNQSYTTLFALQGFAEDLDGNASLNKIIAKGIDRLRSAARIPRAEVWVANENRLELLFHEGGDSLSAEEILIDLDSSSPIAMAHRDKRECSFEDCSKFPESDPLYSESNCALICPITFQYKSLGLIIIQAPKKDFALLNSDIASLTSVFARFLAVAFTCAETFHQRKENEHSVAQLEVASEIQRSLLPSEFPRNAHCRLSGKCVTAQAVGGDYIDAIEIKDHGLLLIIADVMGKGVPAAMLATIFRTAIRSRLTLAETPGWLLSQINKQIHEELGHLNMFITAQAAFFFYEGKKLKLASAGHCPAFLMKAGENNSETLSAEGIPLGIDPTDIYEERLIELDTGDRVLFITDGIYETENQTGEMLGIEGFSKHLPEIWEGGLDAVPDNALSVVTAHSQGGAPQDDKTLMALEVL